MDAFILLALAVTAPAFMILGMSFLTLPGVMIALFPNAQMLLWINQSPNLKRAFFNFSFVVFICAVWGIVNVFKHNLDILFFCAAGGVILMAYAPGYFFSFNLTLSISATFLAVYAISADIPRVGRESYTYEVAVIFNLLLYLFLFVAWYKYGRKQKSNNTTKERGEQ